MNVIVMGTGPFAVPTLKWLIESSHRVRLLVTRPIADAGRRRKSVANPMRELAASSGLKIVEPTSVNDPDVIRELKGYDADLLVVCDFGQILSKECLGVSRKGGINLHASLLPKYRGAAPVNWAIYHGETTTGVTVIHMSPKLDAGPSLIQQSIAIGDGETAGELELRLAACGVSAVADSIELLEQWDGVTNIGVKQDETKSSRAPSLTKRMGIVDWSRNTAAIANQIRAFQPWPGSFTYWIRPQGTPERLIILRARIFDQPEPQYVSADKAGIVLAVSDNGLTVGTGDGLLCIERIQPAGKRPMDVAEYVRGREVKTGDRLAHVDQKK